jgi:glutamate--cysteine ligase
MEFGKQVDKLTSFFQAGETTEKQIGIEVEHFVVDKRKLKTVKYNGKAGIEALLFELKSRKGWQGKEETGHLVELTSSAANITLEPGGQVEIGINPQSNLTELREIYQAFLEDFIPILEERDYYLITQGYQVRSKIDQIPFNPKRRYEIMADYLKEYGKYSHNMMKGTAAFQLAVDYSDEEDFIKKFRVANFLSPVLAILVDNSPIFEGRIYDRQALRTLIWQNTDPKRTGIVKEAFADNFGYRKYAKYILRQEPILLKTGGKYRATGDKTCREIFRDRKLGSEELEHILTMVFPDVRAKQFIEIRMTDSVPPDLMWSLVSFWQGLFYNQSSLDQIYSYLQNFTLADILQARSEIILEGLQANFGNRSVLQVAKKALSWAEEGLNQEQANYLQPLKEIVATKRTPAQQIKANLEQTSRRDAIGRNILNLCWE